MWEVDEARMIKDVTQAIAHNEGKAPAGWMGPGLGETNVTPDLLHEAGADVALLPPIAPTNDTGTGQG